MEIIHTGQAPLPGGHYSQAIKHGDFIFISGQLPIDPATGHKNTGSIEDQTLLVLQNLIAIALAAGSDKNHLIKVTVYIADIQLWTRVNAIYSDFFGDHKPARAIVPTRELHYGFLIEMDAVAVLNRQETD
ncbi:MAG: RidA family protein [Saprospiraceae bacterium]|nr:RidA family protein [Saprospiraceae bacterium]